MGGGCARRKTVFALALTLDVLALSIPGTVVTDVARVLIREHSPSEGSSGVDFSRVDDAWVLVNESIDLAEVGLEFKAFAM